MTLKQLKLDRESLLQEFQKAVLTNPDIQRLQGAINYIDSCIKRIEEKNA